MFKRLKQVFSEDPGIITFERNIDLVKEERDLIYRIPNVEYPDMSKISKIGVKDYTKAVYFKNGKYEGVLSGGTYEVEKEFRNNVTEIIWVDVAILNLTFGISHFSHNIFTSDQFNLGLNGTLKVQIADPGVFINRVVSWKKKFTNALIREFINSLLTTSMRDVVKLYSLREFIQKTSREETKADLKAKLHKEFTIYGIDLIAFDILGTIVPDEQKKAHENVLSEIRRSAENLRKEISEVQLSIRKTEEKITELEDALLEGTIDDKELEKQEIRINKILEKRKEQLKIKQEKLFKLIGN